MRAACQGLALAGAVARRFVIEGRPLAVLADRFINWGGGRVYLTNLLRALTAQPDSPPVVIVSGRPLGDGDLAQLGDRGLYFDGMSLRVRAENSLRATVHRGEFVPARKLRGLHPIGVFGHMLHRRIPGAATLSNILDYQESFYPELSGEVALRRRQVQEERIAATADALYFNSIVSMEDYDRRHPSFKGIRGVIPLFAFVEDEELSLDPEVVSKRYQLPDRFIIVPSQLWSHKNHEQLIKALSLLKKHGSGVTAVFTGTPHDPRASGFGSKVLQLIALEGLHDTVFMLGQLERKELLAIMRQAMGFVQPSLYEGGGLPAEEARLLGKPIVLADLPLQREADIPRAAYFQPGNAEDLASVIGQVFEDASPGLDPDAEGIARANAESRADHIAREFLRVAREVAPR